MERRDFVKRSIIGLLGVSGLSSGDSKGNKTNRSNIGNKVEFPRIIEEDLPPLYIPGEEPKIIEEDLPPPGQEVKDGIKRVYLTIDDGPGYYMFDILNRLKENDGKVTFFVIGENIIHETGFNLMTRAIKEGHLIGNHSYSHPDFHKLSIEKAKSEISRNDDIIERAYNDSGIRRNPNTKLFRFPYGKTNNEIIPYLNELGYKPVRSWDEQKEDDWDIDTLDWKYGRSLSGEKIMKICRKTKDKDVILMHDTVKPKDFTFNNILPYYLNKDEYELIIPS